jgi:hypothetical protein
MLPQDETVLKCAEDAPNLSDSGTGSRFEPYFGRTALLWAIERA